MLIQNEDYVCTRTFHPMRMFDGKVHVPPEDLNTWDSPSLVLTALADLHRGWRDAQWLRALVILPEELGLILKTHMVAHNHL